MGPKVHVTQCPLFSSSTSCLWEIPKEEMKATAFYCFMSLPLIWAIFLSPSNWAKVHLLKWWLSYSDTAPLTMEVPFGFQNRRWLEML